MLIEAGSTQTIDRYRNSESEVVLVRPVEGEQTISVHVMDEWGLQEKFLASVEGISKWLATDGKLDWIECPADGLRALLLDHFQMSPTAIARPQGWRIQDYPKVTKAAAKAAATTTTAMMSLTLLAWGLIVFCMTRLALRTNSGRDWQARIMGDPNSTGSGQYASGSWMGLSSNNTAPNAANLTLANEITSGTLARKQCAYSHTTNTSAYILVAVFTFDQNITIYKLGIFNASAGGAPIFETLLDSAVIGKPGDQTTVSETVTL